MVGWPCSTIVPFIEAELVEELDSPSVIVPAIGEGFAKEGFRQANAADMFSPG